jgi:hypothetical protein
MVCDWKHPHTSFAAASCDNRISTKAKERGRLPSPLVFRHERKGPSLDAQHIELLEMCRSIQQDLDRGHGQNWTLEQKLHEFAFLLEEHEEIEARVFGSRGQNLTQEQSNQRAVALRDVQALADNFERKSTIQLQPGRRLHIGYSCTFDGSSLG